MLVAWSTESRPPFTASCRSPTLANSHTTLILPSAVSDSNVVFSRIFAAQSQNTRSSTQKLPVLSGFCAMGLCIRRHSGKETNTSPVLPYRQARSEVSATPLPNGPKHSRFRRSAFNHSELSTPPPLRHKQSVEDLLAARSKKQKSESQPADWTFGITSLLRGSKRAPVVKDSVASFRSVMLASGMAEKAPSIPHLDFGHRLSTDTDSVKTVLRHERCTADLRSMFAEREDTSLSFVGGEWEIADGESAWATDDGMSMSEIGRAL